MVMLIDATSVFGNIFYTTVLVFIFSLRLIRCSLCLQLIHEEAIHIFPTRKIKSVKYYIDRNRYSKTLPIRFESIACS